MQDKGQCQLKRHKLQLKIHEELSRDAHTKGNWKQNNASIDLEKFKMTMLLSFGLTRAHSSLQAGSLEDLYHLLSKQLQDSKYNLLQLGRGHASCSGTLHRALTDSVVI